MNAKLVKELRRLVREAQKPGTPVSKLLAKPVRTRTGRHAVIAINAQDTERGAYLKLKAAVEEYPEVLEQIRATAAYKKMLRAEQESGGPTFEKVHTP